MSMDGKPTKWRRNNAENFNCLSRVHERYRQTTEDREMDGRRNMAKAKNSAMKFACSMGFAATADRRHLCHVTEGDHAFASIR